MGNDLIKRAFTQSEYTPELIQEMRKCMLDPVHFIRNYIYLQHTKRGKILFDLYPYQEELISQLQANRWVIALLARQMGKTQTISMYLLWYAMFTPDQTVLIASKNNNHAMEIMDRIRFAYECLPNWLKAGCKYYNKHNIEFDNGSRIKSEATTEKTGRGLSISKLYLDELSFINPRIQENMWASLAPTLSTGGSAIISSTPNGDTDLFANLWRGANMQQNSFVPLFFPWNVHPERGEEYLKEMRGQLGPVKVRQEVLCVSGDTLIETPEGAYSAAALFGKLQTALDPSVNDSGKPIPNTLRISILTPTGFKYFGGMTKTWHNKVVHIKTITRNITVGLNHKFLVDSGWLEASLIQRGMSLTDVNGADDPVFSVTIKNEPQYLFDFVDVEGGHSYFSNGVVSHNCEFISSDALLIDSIKLAKLVPQAPIKESLGFQFWKEITHNNTYLVSIDPATGNGRDFTTIEVFDFPGLEQVAEFRSNAVNVPVLYSKIKWLLKILQPKKDGQADNTVLWSFERNGVGEALVAMIQNDMEGDGIYIGNAELYNETLTRLGVYTTGKSKFVSCMQLKNLIERISGGLQIYSASLIFELKNYISSGGTYEARLGCTDDGVSALLVLTKLLNRLTVYNEDARQMVYEIIDAEKYDDRAAAQEDPFSGEPMPFSVL